MSLFGGYFRRGAADEIPAIKKGRSRRSVVVLAACLSHEEDLPEVELASHVILQDRRPSQLCRNPTLSTSIHGNGARFMSVM